MFSISYKTSFHENAFYFLQLILVSEIHEKSTESIVNQLINRNILACSYSQTIVQILWMSENEKVASCLNNFQRISVTSTLYPKSEKNQQTFQEISLFWQN